MSIRKHGLTGTVEYVAWQHMIRRCTDKTLKNYHKYGGRGITVCDRWLGSDGFTNFLEDMGNKPFKNYSLDRIDNNKGYFKDNCRWTSRQVQNINQNAHSDSLTGIKGVTFHKVTQKWMALIGINRKKIYLGVYDTKEEAANARKIAEEKYFKPILDKAKEE